MLDKARIEVLKAYRDNTTHNRSVKVVNSLLSKGYLEPTFKDNKWTLKISEKGMQALNAAM